MSYNLELASFLKYLFTVLSTALFLP